MRGGSSHPSDRLNQPASVATSLPDRYGWPHRRLRRAWARVVAAGDAFCARCGKWIEPGTPWDLGHDDFDPSRYTGPEHARCNRATARHAKERVWSRRW
jgi:hypothetical protein